MREATVSTAVCVLLAWPALGLAQSPGFTPTSPAPIGTPVKSIIQCGGNPTAMEPYDVVVTVKQVLRGKPAWDALVASDPATVAAASGQEYLVAKVSMQMTAKLAPGNKSFELGRPMQWVAMSSDGAEYPAATVAPPKPALTGQLRADEAPEGWLVFQVAQKDQKPVLFFDPGSGGATLRGSVLFFRLN